MADSSETTLRNALDAVDRGRRWATMGIAALFLVTAIAVAALFASAAAAARSASSDTGVMKVIFVGSSTTMLFTACCAVVVMLHISRTTKTLLRAFDLYRR
jgi:uroporphyrinogen-III synthase